MSSNHLVLPHPLPDETLYSLVARIYALNAGLSEREFCSQLLGDPDKIRVSDARVDFPWFGRVTHEYYGDTESVLANTTSYRFFKRLGTSPETEAPRQLSASDDNLSISTGLATLSNGSAPIWKSCRSCIAHDRINYGVAYWHRAHQLPGVVICQRHLESLFEINLPYQTRQKSFVMPDGLADQIDLHQLQTNAYSCELVVHLAKFAEKILLDSAPDNSETVIQGTFFDGLTKAGLVRRSGRINKRAFVDELSAFYHDLASHDEFGPLLRERFLTRLSDSLTNSVQVLPATLNLMLGFWLFSSWELFREHCDWRKAMHSNTHAPAFVLLKGHTTKPLEDSRMTYRQECIDFLQSHPLAMRTDFWHAHPRSSRWLCVHDEEWLDRQLPLSYSHRRIQMKLF